MPGSTGIFSGLEAGGIRVQTVLDTVHLLHNNAGSSILYL